MAIRAVTKVAIPAALALVVTISGMPTALAVSTPSAPRSVAAKPGNTTVRITWLPPLHTGGATIDRYAVQRAAAATGPWRTVASPSSSTFAWKNTGLTNGTRYYYRVRAHNSAGLGTPSTVVSAVPRTHPSAPQSPAAVSGNAALTLSWTAPASDGGAPINEYEVQYSFDEVAWTKVSAGTQTQLTVLGLQNGAEYFLRVRAHNVAGWGPASSEVTAVPGEPLPPTDVTAQSSAIGVYVGYTPSATTSPAVAGVYVAVSTDDIHWTNVAAIPNTGHYTYTGTFGVTYYFRLSAFTQYANSVWTDAVSAVDGLPPGPVGNLTATYSTQLVANLVNWDVPTTGSPVQSYNVERKVTGGIYHYLRTVDAGHHGFADTDISHGTGYSYRITPSNELGSGPASEVHIDTP
jgi:hypothetical protein